MTRPKLAERVERTIAGVRNGEYVWSESPYGNSLIQRMVINLR